MAKLILIRHGETAWNKEGLWQGQTDIDIDSVGQAQAASAAEAIQGIQIDQAFTSELARTKETYEIIAQKLNLTCPVISNAALNERNYGVYTGKNKWEIEKEVGEEEFQKIRRSYSYPIPNGETLEDVYNRAVPFYKNEIEKNLLAGKNVLVVSSNNAIRALIKYLENKSAEEIVNLALSSAEVLIYDLDQNGKVVSKEIKKSPLS